MVKSYIQINGKLIPKDEYSGNNVRGLRSPNIIPDLTPFQSPIDGQIITTRSMLKRHNKAHGVTNSADYSKEFMAKKQHEREMRLQGATKDDTAERIEAIKQAIYRS